MTDLSIFQDSEMPALPEQNKALAQIITSGDFFPRIQLMTSNSKECKSGRFPINHYALVNGKDFTDCGEQVDVAILTMRLKALDTSADQPISIFNPEVDEHENPIGEFKRIMDESKGKDSGCMFGPEVLIYIPEQKKYATFFMGTKSARRESPNLIALLRKGATLMSQHIETKQFAWYAPKIQPCQTELVLPDVDEVLERIKKFEAEESTKLGEVVSDDETKQQERAR